MNNREKLEEAEKTLGNFWKSPVVKVGMSRGLTVRFYDELSENEIADWFDWYLTWNSMTVEEREVQIGLLVLATL